MRHRTLGLTVGLFLVGILALASTGVGIALMQRASEPGSVALQVSPVSGVTHVFMRNNAYQPTTIQVVVGTAVAWTNEDSVVHGVVLPHVVTAQSDANLGESGSLSQGQSFSYTFTSVGTFEYHCDQHPYMMGMVIVTPQS